MAKTTTHNEIMLRPPPGTRFTIWGSDVHLQFERGKEREIVNWLHNWINLYVMPEVHKAEAEAEAKTKVRAKVKVEAPKSNSEIIEPNIEIEESKSPGQVWSTTSIDNGEA